MEKKISENSCEKIFFCNSAIFQISESIVLMAVNEAHCRHWGDADYDVGISV